MIEPGSCCPVESMGSIDRSIHLGWAFVTLAYVAVFVFDKGHSRIGVHVVTRGSFLQDRLYGFMYNE